MRFPCSLNLDENRIFIIGLPWVNFNADLNAGGALAYIFNRVTGNWTSSLGFNLPCESVRGAFTCAYLKPENLVFVGIDHCAAALNLTAKKWTPFEMTHRNGILFNRDSDMNEVLYIGSDKRNGSDIYMVNIYNGFLLKRPPRPGQIGLYNRLASLSKLLCCIKEYWDQKYFTRGLFRRNPLYQRCAWVWFTLIGDFFLADE